MKVKDIFYYIQGNIRYRLFYSTFARLIREHILEQIIARVNSMDNECYSRGQCKLCGCSTTALQMCDKACDKPCYPAMLNKKEWKELKDFGVYVDKKNNVWDLFPDEETFKFKLIIK